MFTIKKIAVNSWNTDGSCVYENSLYFNSWRETMRYLKQHNNSPLWYGKGAHIFRNDELLGNISELHFVAMEANKTGYIDKITLREFRNA